MGAAKSMCTGESNNILVIEANYTDSQLTDTIPSLQRRNKPHAVEDIPKMVSTLCSIRETAIWGCLSSESVNASWAPGDVRSSHFLRM